MSVVINEFEVVVDPPAAADTSPSPEPASDARPLAAFEVERIARFLDERKLRVWAH